MTTATVAALDADAIGRIGDHHDEPDWLRALARELVGSRHATPPPTGQEEEWRRTDLAGLPRDGQLLAGHAAPGDRPFRPAPARPG